MNHKLAKEYGVKIEPFTIKKASIQYGINVSSIRNMIYAGKIHAIKRNVWHLDVEHAKRELERFHDNILLIINRKFSRMLPFVLDNLKCHFIVGHNYDDVMCKIANMSFELCIVCENDFSLRFIRILRLVSNLPIWYISNKKLNDTVWVKEDEVSTRKIQSLFTPK